MKLYVWENLFRDYTTGLAVVLAKDSENARDLLREKIGYDHPDLGQKPSEYDLKGPIAFFVHGGG